MIDQSGNIGIDDIDHGTAVTTRSKEEGISCYIEYIIVLPNSQTPKLNNAIS